MDDNRLKTTFTQFGDVTDVKIIFKGTKSRRFCFIGNLTPKNEIIIYDTTRI